MEAGTRESILTERNTDKDYISGSMDQSMRVAGPIIRSVATVNIVGQMAVSMKANGRRTTCMVGAPTLGVMADDMKVITSMTKSTGRVLMFGLMVDPTLVDGKTANSMVKEPIVNLMEEYVKAFGRKANVHTGMMKW